LVRTFLWTYRTWRGDGFDFAVGTIVEGESDRGSHALFTTVVAMERYIRAWQEDFPTGDVLRGMGA
jgi:hypothetical protein